MFLDILNEVNLSLEDGSEIKAPTLAFLREGANTSTRLIIEAILDTIVANTQHCVNTIIGGGYNQEVSQDVRSKIHDQLCCLALLVENYPELAISILSYEVSSDNFKIAAGVDEFLPKSEDKQTFLSFFVRHACYLYNFSVLYFLEYLIAKKATPIFIEYDHQPVLLSAYNELLILNEITLCLEETLEAPEVLFDTIYTISVWSILSQMSLRLLYLPGEDGQKNFKLQIIQRLSGLCSKALQTFSQKKTKGKQFQEDKLKIFYMFMTGLIEVEMTIKAKIQTSKMKNGLTKKELLWACHLSKEESYLGSKGFDIQDKDGLKTYTGTLSLNEKPVLTNYSFKLQEVDQKALTGKVLRII